MLTGYKDVDFKILSLLDDRELLIICMNKSEDPYVNRLCSDEKFMENRVYQKYGHVSKNPERTWKNLYLNLTYYTDKYTKYKAIEELAEGGYKNIDLIKYFLQESLNDIDINKGLYENIMIAAGKSGDLKLIKFFNKLSPDYFAYARAMYGAGFNNHKELIYYLSKNYFIPLSNALFSIAAGGDEELINEAIKSAKREEKQIFREGSILDKAESIIFPSSVIHWNRKVLEGAAYGGHLNLVKKYINKPFVKIDRYVLGNAAKGRSISIFSK